MWRTRKSRRSSVGDEELPPRLTRMVLLDETVEGLLVQGLDGGDEFGVSQTLAAGAEDEHGGEETDLTVSQADGVELRTHEEEAVQELAHRHGLDHLAVNTHKKTQSSSRMF